MSKHVSWPRILLIACLVLVAGLGADTMPAVAVEPDKHPIEFTYSLELTDICAFPLTIFGTVTGTEILYFDQDGVLTRLFNHAVEQDTFSANGKALVGLPFNVNMEFRFDESGNLMTWYGAGFFERVPLPDGSVFLSAGRAEFVQHHAVVLLSPDKGNPGNLAAFCAALAP